MKDGIALVSKHVPSMIGLTQQRTKSNGSCEIRNYRESEYNPFTQKIYKCEVCEFSTASNRDFKYHFLTHNKNAKIFECEFCSFVTRHTNVRDAHKLTHLRADEIVWYECKSCTFKTKRKANLDKHELTHEKSNVLKRFRCKDCPYNSLWKRDLERHLLIHKKPEDVPVYHCEYCAFKTKHQRYLKYHVQKVHLGEENPPDEIFYCANCDFSTRYKRGLKSHMIRHRERKMIYKCEHCTYVTDLSQLLKCHMARHTKSFRCDQCDFSTNLKRYLVQHIQGHNPVDQRIIYNCAKCPFSTTYKSGIVNHRLVHKSMNETEVFSCEQCEYKTKRRQDLKAHVVNIHSDDLPYYHCAYCTYKSRFKTNFINHVKFVHMNEKVVLYSCQFCNLTIKTKSYKKNHEDTCNKNPNKKPKVTCAECGFKTKDIPLLKKHMVLHQKLDEIKMYKCGYCMEFETRYRRALVIHIKRHRPEFRKGKKESLLKCNNCRFKTKHKCDLDNHISTKHLDVGDKAEVTKCIDDKELSINCDELKVQTKICCEELKIKYIDAKKVEHIRSDYNENVEYFDDIKIEPTMIQMNV